MYRLIVDLKKVTDDVRRHLRSDRCQRGSATTFLCVILQPYCRKCILDAVRQETSSPGAKIWVIIVFNKSFESSFICTQFPS